MEAGQTGDYREAGEEHILVAVLNTLTPLTLEMNYGRGFVFL